ncbi:unnamed protein product [Psylliodes chrysocephalus]|uniref:Uncharacterized protein n=1 Tax=Psylliodes chrysocephalus TaxID=3402493 RepID=A0A9P0CYI6_9CUCU|nr:unnamed protein product [Psylliodes chrysocephala]
MFSQLLMFGLIAAAFIVIPMGFQFLAILGGKALLLAKMALLLTSIQGLKKIATSNFNYGLYSTHGQHQPCKTFDIPGLLDVFLSFDVESLRGGGYGYFDGRVFCLGQYDRQWPFDNVEGQRGPNSYEGYDYLHPRIDIVKE